MAKKTKIKNLRAFLFGTNSNYRKHAIYEQDRDIIQLSVRRGLYSFHVVQFFFLFSSSSFLLFLLTFSFTLKTRSTQCAFADFLSPIVSIIYVFLLHIPSTTPTYNILIIRPIISPNSVLFPSPFPFRLNSISYAVWRL